MLNRRLLVYTSGGGSGPASLVITVIDYDTKQPVANAMVSLYDEFNAFIANLGFTDNSGVIMFADFTLSPGGYWFQADALGYMISRVSYTVLSEAPINDEIEIAIQKPLIPPSIVFIVKDKETGAGIANAYVYLRDGNHQMLMQLGITDSSGILTLSGLTLEPGEYYFDASASGYNALLLGYPFTVTDSSPITATITFELQKGFVLPPT